IIHLAGKAHDMSNTSNESEYFKINRDLTISLFDFFLNSSTRDFIYFSSVKAIADTVDDVLIEETEAKPITAYGKSKLAAEEYIMSQTIPLGKRVFIIRPCMIHGPGNKGNLNLLYKIVKRGIPWPLAAFDNHRSFLSIYNLNYLIDRLLNDEKVSSNIFNFADDTPVSTNCLISLISDGVGRKNKAWYIPVSIIKLIARVGDVVSLPLNSERLKKLTESYVVSNLKVKRALGIEQLPLSAEQGLEITIRSFNEISKYKEDLNLYE